MVELKHIDAFTRVPFTGNPAGVILAEEDYSPEIMQKIAGEMNLSETAFLLKPTLPSADLQIRWFTPSGEVSFCGHATVASFHALAEAGRMGMRECRPYTFRLQTKSGILTVTVYKESKNISFIQVQVPQPSFRAYSRDLNPVLKSLGIGRREMSADLPVEIDQRGILYLPLSKLDCLLNLMPDFNQVKKTGHSLKINAVCPFTLETLDPESDFHSRFFAPVWGVNEDPVTGSSNGPLGAYLVRHVEIPGEGGVYSLTGEQGDAIGRKGRVTVFVEKPGKAIKRVMIGGYAVTLYKTTLPAKLFHQEGE
jgi:PhzF family phenazine biosynthesis protein